MDDLQWNMEAYRSGHNGPDSKSGRRQRLVGSNPTASARLSLDAIRVQDSAFSFALPLAFIVGIFFVNASQKSMARKPSNIKGLRAFPFFALSLTNCGGLSFFEMSLLFSGCFWGDIFAHSVGKTEIIAFAEAIFEEKSRWV